MLKQKPLSYYQSSIFTKKPKKRSSSTSANKQNLSITHNNSIVLEPNSNLNSKAHLNSKLSKNLNLNKQKSKKTKKFQSRQKSTSKLPLTNNLVHEQNKHQPVKQKQHQPQAKKTKKSRNNSTSIIYHQQQHKSYTKSFINERSQLALQMKKQNNPTKYPNTINNNFIPQMSKSSTIVSSSTGNIQFSEWSREDPYDKNSELLGINNLIGFNKQIKSANNSKRQEYVVKSARERLSVNDKYKMTPVRAAVMIQKTWRGYLTRKLLSEYINSFQPLYEEQLKDIRSGRQSRNEAKSMISSNRKCHEKSSFFDKSQLEECSQIQPIESQISESFRTTNKLHNETSSLLFTENNNQQQSSQTDHQLKQSGKNFNISIKQKNVQLCDMPVQFFKKPVVLASTTKREQSNFMSDKSIEEFGLSSRRKNAMKVTPQTVSRVSEFTIKHPTHTSQTTTSHKQQPPTKQTLKHPHHHHPSTLTLNPKTFYLSISPYKLSPLQQLQVHCQSLSRLFHSFNLECIGQLKTQIKMNKLMVKELMERKEALGDIVENGMEFVRNVEEEIGKAFREMRRIVREGCEETSSSSDRDNNNDRVYGSSQSQSHLDSPAQHPQPAKTIHPNPNKIKNPTPSPKQKISNQKYIHDLQSPPFSYETQIDSSSSSRKHYNKRVVRCNTKSGTSEFYMIDLPTEEYEVKGKSPIREDCQEEDNEEESYQQQEQHEPNQGQHQDQEQEDYSGRTLKMTPLYTTHHQSLQILNQFLLNLIQQYQQISSTKSISQLQYLCQTLKRVSCDSQNKTIIDRCLIEFIVEIMSETWTLREIYEGFRRVVKEGYREGEDEEGQGEQDSGERVEEGDTQTDWKLLKTIHKWIQQLYKWQMNIIQQVPSKMQSSSFINTQNISLINTENISLNDLRQAVNNLSNPTNFQLDLHSTYCK